MNHETAFAAIFGAAATLIVGILGFLGLRRQSSVTAQQTEEAGLRVDIAGLRTERNTWQTRADLLQTRLDTERAAWEAREQALNERNRQLEYQAILMRRALERAGVPVPHGALDQTP
jgi:hypothetical protein